MAVITVTTALDVVDAGDGVVSLREALAIANGDNGADTINFHGSLAGKTITLTGGELEITTDITINGDVTGDYRADITISGNDTSRIFNITGGATDAALLSLTLRDGWSTGKGGALYAVNVNSLTIIDTTIRDSYAGVDDPSTPTAWEGSDPGAEGGAVHVSAGNLWMGNTSLLDNFADGRGGAMVFESGYGVMQNVTIADNGTMGEGGGLVVGNMTALDIFSSSIVRNKATIWMGDGDPGAGGGILVDSYGYLSLRNSVVAENYANVDMYNGVGTWNDVKGTVTSGYNNVFGSAATVLGNPDSNANLFGITQLQLT